MSEESLPKFYNYTKRESASLCCNRRYENGTSLPCTFRIEFSSLPLWLLLVCLPNKTLGKQNSEQDLLERLTPSELLLSRFRQQHEPQQKRDGSFLHCFFCQLVGLSSPRLYSRYRQKPDLPHGWYAVGVSAYQREPYGMFGLQTSLPPEAQLLKGQCFVEQTGVEPVSEYPFLGFNELTLINFENKKRDVACSCKRLSSKLLPTLSIWQTSC